MDPHFAHSRGNRASRRFLVPRQPLRDCESRRAPTGAVLVSSAWPRGGQRVLGEVLPDCRLDQNESQRRGPGPTDDPDAQRRIRRCRPGPHDETRNPLRAPARHLHSALTRVAPTRIGTEDSNRATRAIESLPISNSASAQMRRAESESNPSPPKNSHPAPQPPDPPPVHADKPRERLPKMHPSDAAPLTPQPFP